MVLYCNTRAWRLSALVYGFGVAVIGAVALALYGFAASNRAAIDLGCIFTALALLVALALALFFRRMVVSLRLEGDRLAIETWALGGARTESVAANGVRIGGERHDTATTVDNRWRTLTVPGRRTALIVDVTDHPEAGQELAHRFSA